MRSQENRYEVAEQHATAKIHPGEAVHFMMNDNIDQFANNSGSQTIYWRCTSCTDAMKEVPTHQIRVRANQKGGTTFRSRAGMTGQFRTAAYGFWRVAMFGSGNCGPTGTSRTCGTSCPAKSEKLGALILRNNDDEDGLLVGSGKVMSIGGTKPVAFMMNDDNYSDNSGAVQVILQCQRCDMSSHEVDIDPNDAP